jgi:hypothetical protein
MPIKPTILETHLWDPVNSFLFFLLRTHSLGCTSYSLGVNQLSVTVILITSELPFFIVANVYLSYKYFSCLLQYTQFVSLIFFDKPVYLVV